MKIIKNKCVSHILLCGRVDLRFGVLFNGYSLREKSMSKLEVSIDWLSITFSVKDMEDGYIINSALAAIGTRMPRLSVMTDCPFDSYPVVGSNLMALELDRGFMGFTKSAELYFAQEDR